MVWQVYYAVILCDMPSQGQSSFVGHTGGYGNYTPNVGQPGGGEDVTEYVIAITEQLRGLNYVDQNKLILAGFSAGHSWAVQGAVNFCANVYKTVMTLSGYVVGNQKTVSEAGMNFIGINAKMSFREPPAFEIVPGQISGEGSFKNGTATHYYLHSSAVQHQMQPTTPSLIAAACDVLEMAYPTNTSVASGSTSLE